MAQESSSTLPVVNTLAMLVSVASSLLAPKLFNSNTRLNLVAPVKIDWKNDMLWKSMILPTIKGNKLARRSFGWIQTMSIQVH